MNGVKHITLDHHRRLVDRPRSSSASRSTPDRAVNDVKDAVAKIRADLPRTIDEPIIQRVDDRGPADRHLCAPSAPAMTPEELSWFVDDSVARAAAEREGRRSQVERVGGVDREIRVALDPDRLLALGITAADVNRQLRPTNVDLAGGRGEIGGQEQAIRTLGGASSRGRPRGHPIVAAGRPQGAAGRTRRP